MQSVLFLLQQPERAKTGGNETAYFLSEGTGVELAGLDMGHDQRCWNWDIINGRRLMAGQEWDS